MRRIWRYVGVRSAHPPRFLAGTLVAAALLMTVYGFPSTASATSARAKRIPITFWSASSGTNGIALAHLAAEFNSSQSRYQVTAIYKGSYSTVLASTIAAFRAHNAPNIAMIFDAGTGTMMDSSGVYVPVHTLMAKEHIAFKTSDFIGGAASYYETASDQLDSLPFNSSTPVLYYNKALLKAAGVSPPATWTDVATDASKLAAHGSKCVLTSSGAYVMWTDIEQFAVWNGYPLATEDNGYKSIKNVRLEIDTAPFIQHLTLLGDLAAKGLYRWNGVNTSTIPLFTSGTCALYEQSSGDYNVIAKGMGANKFGVTRLPIVAGDRRAPQNTVVGGASLWVLAGAPSDTYKGDAEFLHFLMSAQSQAYWSRHTGYVAVTNAGVALLKKQGFYKSDPAALVPIHELSNKPVLAWTRGVRLGPLPAIRVDEANAIEEILSGKESAAKALATAQTQGDVLLKQFAQEYAG